MLQEKALLEALLFAPGEPVTLETLKEITGLSGDRLQGLVARLQEEYRERESGLSIREVAGGYLMTTSPRYAPYLRQLFQEKSKQPLTRAALETLSIIAYRQPVTRVEIEAIRGVKVERLLATLEGKKLIRGVGRKETVGRPLLYGTTVEFLRYFGLRSLEELPPLGPGNGSPGLEDKGPEEKQGEE